MLQSADSCASCSSSVVKSYGFMTSEGRNIEIRCSDEEGELASYLGNSSGGSTDGSVDEDSSSFHSAINSLNNSSHTNSTVVSLSSKEPPRKQARVEDQAMDDVQMMGETTFVWSSPISLPQDLPSVEPFEDGDRSYSDDSSEVESTISQEGIMSSSGTISSSASSTGHTINTSASTGSMMATNSSLSPVVEAEEEEAKEKISSADNAPPSVLPRLNAPQIEEHKETPRGSTRSSDKR